MSEMYDPNAQSYPLGGLKEIVIDYTNYKDERDLILVRPISLDYTYNEYHPVRQLLLVAQDLSRNVTRTYAIRCIHNIYPSDEANEEFMACCRSELMSDVVAAGTAIQKLLMSPSRIDNIKALRVPYIAHLEEGIKAAIGVSEILDRYGLTPEIEEAYRRAADVVFNIMRRTDGDDVKRNLLNAAVAIIDIAPALRTKWVEIEALGTELDELRRENRSLRNILTVNGIDYKSPQIVKE